MEAAIKAVVSSTDTLIEAENEKNEIPDFKFEQVGKDRLQLRFGACCLELNSDGTMSFRNTESEMKLLANGDVKVVGNNIHQKSKRDMYIESKHELHINSAH
tara:strand:+ start:43962 stop:44267 length:306 start_codon:yes stop_codon:yes gene_type:complete